MTETRKVALFQILEVPYSTTLYTLANMGMLTHSTSFSAAGQSAAKTAIEATITEVEANATLATDVLVDLDRWNTIRTSRVSITDGGADGIPGVRTDPEDELKAIRERIRVTFPYYKAHEVFAKELAAAGGPIIPAVR